ncbi:MAG: hypothetical protein CM1200mP18_13760 [Gammaproteobacteria bacterium]|nr:MAG: hypothetical protein CM1200mP18_13760 [Gammaproteobacteria bacterium]
MCRTSMLLSLWSRFRCPKNATGKSPLRTIQSVITAELITRRSPQVSSKPQTYDIQSQGHCLRHTTECQNLDQMSYPIDLDANAHAGDYASWVFLADIFLPGLSRGMCLIPITGSPGC